jgi:hypothetical protein
VNVALHRQVYVASVIAHEGGSFHDSISVVPLGTGGSRSLERIEVHANHVSIVVVRRTRAAALRRAHEILQVERKRMADGLCQTA